jgi:alpha-L-fucosidase 2
MGEIHLLPALPQELNTGSISGLKGRGGYTINMDWKDGELIKAEILYPAEMRTPVIRLGSDIVTPEEYPNITIKRI